MKKIGRHAKHAFALVLALIMVFGTVSVPALALAESGAPSQGESGAASTPSGNPSEGASGAEGTVTTPWYVLDYSYIEKKMTLTLKADIFSYTDITASDLSAFKDALFDAFAHMLVGDISDIKKPDAEGGEESLCAVWDALYFVTLTDLYLAEGTTTMSSERVEQLRAFFASRGITKVSQVDIPTMIPVLVQLGYVTYEELDTLDWDRVFAVFEEELEKEIAEDMAAEDMAAEDMAAEEIAKSELSAQGVAEPTAPAEGASEEEMEQYVQAKAEYDQKLDTKKNEVLTDESKKTELDAKKNEVLTDESKKTELDAKKNEVLADESKKTELEAKRDEVRNDETKQEQIAQKKDESGAMEDIKQAKQDVQQTVTENKDKPEASERNDVNLTKAVLDAMKLIKVDGTAIFDGSHLLTDGLRAVIEALPTLAEIADYTDEEMTHTWKVYADSAFGASEFDFILSLDGDSEPLRRAAGLIADYVVYERRVDGTLALTLNLPKKFADLVLRVCNSDKFKDSVWKDRIFDNIFSTGNDIYALINDTAFSDILDALSDFDFNGVIGEEEIKDLYGSALTNEEILEKIRSTEALYNKAVSLFNTVFSGLSEGAKDKNIFDFYKGDGVFGASGGRDNVNIEATLSKLLPEAYKGYASLIAGMLEEQTVSISADVTVRFTDMYRVTFMGDKTQYTLLPVGATLSDFAKAMTYQGYPIVGWSNADSSVKYTEMPAEDVVLYPVIDARATAEILTQGVLSKVYDDQTLLLTAQVTYDDVYGRATYTYQWYKDGVKLEGATGETLSLKNVSDSGNYYCIVTVTDGADSFPATSDTVTVSVTAREYSFADHFLWDYTSPFYPDGQTHTVSLLASNVDAYAGLHIAYTGDANTQSAVGRYTTGASVTFDNENCVLVGTVPSLTWSVGTREFDITDADGNKLGTVTLKTNGVAMDPTLRFVATIKGALDLEAVKAQLPAGADKVVAPYVYELAFLDEAGNAVPVNSALSFTFTLKSDIAASHLAVMSVNGSALTAVASSRDADTLTFESDAHLTSAEATFAIVSYQYKLTLSAGQGYTGVYDGTEHTIGAPTVSYAGESDATFAYSWYKGGSLLAGADTDTYRVKTVAQSGSYELWVTVTDGYAVHTERITFTVSVAKLSVDLSTFLWSATELPYRGTEQEVTLQIPSAAALAEITFTYSGNKATAVGNYTATATVASYDSANCELVGTLPQNAWSISNKVYTVIDHFGNEITVSSETAFPTGYTLVAEWIGDFEGTLPPLTGYAGSLIGGHRIYFKNESGQAVSYSGQVTVTLTVPASEAALNVRVATLTGTTAALSDASRTENVFTLTASALDKDTAYLLVAYRTLLDTSRVSIDSLVYRLLEENREITITAELLKNLPEGVLASIDTGDGSDYSASDVGTYTVRVTFTLAEGYEGYALDAAARNVTWSITPYAFLFGTLGWNYASELIYRGSDYVFRVPAAEAYAEYFDIRYTNDTAKNVGTYRPAVSFSLKSAYRANCTLNGAADATVSQSALFTVVPKVISTDLLLWNETSFVFDGEAHRPTMKPLDSYTIDGVNDLLSDIIEIGAYSGEEAVHVLASNAAPYVVTVSLSVKNENYRLTASTHTLAWQITPKPLSLDDVKLEKDLFLYDGTVKKAVLDLTTLPAELTAFLDPATEVSATDRGTHRVTAVLKLKAGYRALDYSFNSRLDLAYSIKTPIDPSVFTFGETSLVYRGSEWNVPALIFGEEYASTLRIESADGTLAATDAGTYRVTYTFSVLNPEKYYLTTDTASYRWTIEKQKITVPALTWTQGSFTYDTAEHSVKVATSLHENILLVYNNEKAKNAGEYTAKVTLALIDSANYELVDIDKSTYEYAWEIRQATVTVPAFSWQEEISFGYDGEEKTVTALLPLLPDGVILTYEENSKTNAGTYLARAILTHNDDNYRVVIGDTDSNVSEQAWEILPISITVGELTWNLTDREFVYSEEARSFLVTSTLPEHVTLQYVVDGNVTNVIGDVGTYTVRVLLVADENYAVADGAEREFTFTVTKKQITVNASDLTWVTDAASNRYDAKAHTYTLIGIPAHVKAVYEGNSETARGEYTAVATLLPENGNYEVVLNGTIPTVAWSIVKGVYDMSGVSFEDATFNYDGRKHSLTVTGTLPKGVDASYSLKDKTEAGIYTVTVTFKGSDNYEPIPSMTAVMTILRDTYTVIGTGGAETLVITAPNGMTYRLNMVEKNASDYKNLSFVGIGTLNQSFTPRAAYDIFFSDGADDEVRADGSFTVKLLIPESLRSKDLKVIHLTDDGETEDMNATREGDYLVFTTDGFSVYMIAESAPILSDFMVQMLLIAACVFLLLLVILHIVAHKKKAKHRLAHKEYPDILKGTDRSAFNFGSTTR